MYIVYALYSPNHKKIYTGYTSDLEQRLMSHNYYGKKGYTVKYRPWEIIYFEEQETESEALKREKQLKSSKGRDFIWSKVKSKYFI